MQKETGMWRSLHEAGWGVLMFRICHFVDGFRVIAYHNQFADWGPGTFTWRLRHYQLSVGEPIYIDNEKSARGQDPIHH